MGSESLTSTIITAVADANGVDPVDLDYVLQDHIEMDAVRTLADHPNSTWTLSFELPDQTVTVTSDGDVTVEGSPKPETS